MEENEKGLKLHPEYKKTLEKIEKTKVELSMLLVEHSELLLVECKNMEAQYMLELGGLEYEAYSLYCLYLQLKREIELIQARINRQEDINMVEISEILEKELEEYIEKLNKQQEKLIDALWRESSEDLKPEEVKELKTIYRKLILKLHPDLNNDLTKEEREIFVEIVKAYEIGDLKKLKLIEHLVNNQKEADLNNTPETMEQLKKELEKLKENINLINQSIAEIKRRPPYTLKNILEDHEEVMKRKENLYNSIEELQMIVETYVIRRDELLESLDE